MPFFHTFPALAKATERQSFSDDSALSSEYGIQLSRWCITSLYRACGHACRGCAAVVFVLLLALSYSSQCVKAEAS